MSRMTLADATALIGRAEAAAAANGWALTIAVVDAGGHLVALHRMDGAPFVSAEVAIGKAWTAAAWRTPSAAQGDKARSLPQFAAAVSVMTGGRHTPQIGGLPIVRDGELVGGIGASGATGEQDEQAVRAALEETA